MLPGGHRRVEREWGVEEPLRGSRLHFHPGRAPFWISLSSVERVNSSQARLMICAAVPRVGGVTMDGWRHHLLSTHTPTPGLPGFILPPLGSRVGNGGGPAPLGLVPTHAGRLGLSLKRSGCPEIQSGLHWASITSPHEGGAAGQSGAGLFVGLPPGCLSPPAASALPLVNCPFPTPDPRAPGGADPMAVARTQAWPFTALQSPWPGAAAGLDTGMDQVRPTGAGPATDSDGEGRGRARAGRG